MIRAALITLVLGSLTPSVMAASQASLTQSTDQNGEIALNFSSPIIYRTERFSDRLVVNLYKVRMDRSTDDLSRLHASWVDHITTQNLMGDSVRLSLYFKKDISLNIYGIIPTTSLIITPKEHKDDSMGLADIVESRAPDNSPPQSPDNNTGGREDRNDSNDGTIWVDKINFENGGAICRLQCDLTGSARPQAFLLTMDASRPRLVFDIPGAKINPPEQTIPVPDNPLIQRIRTGVFDHSVARVVLDLKRKVNFAITRDNDGKQLVLSMSARDGGDVSLGSGVLEGNEVASGGSTLNGDPNPNGQAPSLEAGSLQGRTIVIDAGHGGYDNGTRGNGMKEKDLTLDISRRLYAILKDAGVNAVLTRGDDRFIKLQDRPTVANQSNADAFVAIHINSTGSATNIWSGTETYFHFQDPICKEFARYIQASLVQAIGLPDRGARSDTTIAKRLGFSVLRHSQVPAVLVEVGYLNHPNDAAKLGNPDFRQRAAEGIMAGLRTYFGRNDRTARRSGNE